MNRRDLTETELGVLKNMLSTPFPGSNALQQQLMDCQASDAGDNDTYGSIYLHPKNGLMARTTSRVPVEAKIIDQDEVPIFVLLHVDDGLLSELEIYKADGTSLLKNVIPSELKVSVREA